MNPARFRSISEPMYIKIVLIVLEHSTRPPVYCAYVWDSLYNVCKKITERGIMGI
jgi:hypothetical protein